jgi:RimJ/RimL family protein N-acetyltransferase
MSFLVGTHVELRPVTEADLDGPYAHWINDQASDVFTGHAQFPASRGDLLRYLESRTGTDRHIWLAIVTRPGAQHVGNIELSAIDWVHRTARFAILVGDKSAQGRGVGFEAGRLLISHAFGKLNLHRLELGVHPLNAAAIHLYRKLGFREEGRLREAFLRGGEFSDLLVMGLLATELPAAAAVSDE